MRLEHEEYEPMAETLSLLLSLQEKLASITPKQIITPALPRPVEAKFLGYAPPRLQVIHTLYMILSEVCDDSTEAADVAAAEQAFMLAQARALPEDELEEYYLALQVARAKLSPFETIVNFVWTLFLAEAALLYPSEAYVHSLVAVCDDWSIVAMPPEEDDKEEEPSEQEGETEEGSGYTSNAIPRGPLN